jgi:hypothetical protein
MTVMSKFRAATRGMSKADRELAIALWCIAENMHDGKKIKDVLPRIRALAEERDAAERRCGSVRSKITQDLFDWVEKWQTQ